jgi:hypothetical protein
MTRKTIEIPVTHRHKPEDMRGIPVADERKPEPVLWLTDAHGIYIPRDFANSFKDRAKHVTGVSDEDWEILETGPDHELYWDTWTDVLDCAVITDIEGNKFNLYQEGDLWFIPEGMEFSDDADFWQWPELD